MEVEIEGETLEPRRKIPGAAYAHGLVAGSGVIGPRHDADNVTDGGYDAAFVVVNNELPNNDSGFGIKARAANAGLHVDNLRGDGELNQSDSPEDNPDIILGGEYLDDGDGSTGVDNTGSGVIASEPELSFPTSICAATTNSSSSRATIPAQFPSFLSTMDHAPAVICNCDWIRMEITPSKAPTRLAAQTLPN